MAITITDGLSSLNSGPEKREKQIFQINIKCLKIPTGGRQNSYLHSLFTQHSWVVEIGVTEDKSSEW